jgi:hypothetical protein
LKIAWAISVFSLLPCLAKAESDGQKRGGRRQRFASTLVVTKTED